MAPELRVDRSIPQSLSGSPQHTSYPVADCLDREVVKLCLKRRFSLVVVLQLLVCLRKSSFKRWASEGPDQIFDLFSIH